MNHRSKSENLTEGVFVAFQQSGEAEVLREHVLPPTPHRSAESEGFRFLISDQIDLGSSGTEGIWQYLYHGGSESSPWLNSALATLAGLSTSQADRGYAELALRQAAHVSDSEPRIYEAPNGGVVIEHRSPGGNLTAIIERPIGLIVRTAEDFIIKEDFNITSDSINELLARYVFELELLCLSESTR